MKRIALFLFALAFVIMLSGCSTTYYIYYEVRSAEEATISSTEDAYWTRSGKTPTRCIGVYPDSTGHPIFVMESKISSKKKDMDVEDKD